MAKASLGFAFFSFMPFLHLVALILGIVSLKRGRRFILKAAIACCVGGFFTILYALLIVGHFAGQTKPFACRIIHFWPMAMRKYSPMLISWIRERLKMFSWQLDDSSAASSSRDWTMDTALAIAKYEEHDLNGALKDFYSALQKKPERSEFYFYYGLALLENDNADMAREQFQLALEHEPKLKIAEQYLLLVQNMYKPDLVSSALMYLVILFFLFTVHEYGHAFAAWKLGDDTAKNQGRLTLNPIVHLDLFGSIILTGHPPLPAGRHLLWLGAAGAGRHAEF